MLDADGVRAVLFGERDAALDDAGQRFAVDPELMGSPVIPPKASDQTMASAAVVPSINSTQVTPVPTCPAAGLLVCVWGEKVAKRVRCDQLSTAATHPSLGDECIDGRVRITVNRPKQYSRLIVS